MPRPSAGCCRSRSSACRRGSRSSRRRRSALARLLWTRGPLRILALARRAHGCRMAARPCAHRLSLEPFGYALTGPLVLAQAAALIGLWGLTFLAVWLFASPAVLADERADTRRPVADGADPCSRCSRSLRPTALCGSRRSPTAIRRRRAAAHHAAESAAGRKIQLRRPAAGDGALPRAVRPRRPARTRPACAT